MRNDREKQASILTFRIGEQIANQSFSGSTPLGASTLQSLALQGPRDFLTRSVGRSTADQSQHIVSIAKHADLYNPWTPRGTRPNRGSSHSALAIALTPARLLVEVVAAATLAVWRQACSHPPGRRMPTVGLTRSDGFRWVSRCGACGAEVAP